QCENYWFLIEVPGADARESKDTIATERMFLGTCACREIRPTKSGNERLPAGALPVHLPAIGSDHSNPQFLSGKAKECRRSLGFVDQLYKRCGQLVYGLPTRTTDYHAHADPRFGIPPVLVEPRCYIRRTALPETD